MARIVFVYGLISGAVIIAGIIGTLVLNGGAPHANVWLGYLIMLVALSAILVGVKQHRDQALGGVIRFWPALGLGLGIALVASAVYIVVWEVYLAATDYAFMDQYIAAMLAQKRAEGASPAAYAAFAQQMETARAQYANPLLRMGITFTEIFPVGLLIALASAALLRNPRFLPARGRGAA